MHHLLLAIFLPLVLTEPLRPRPSPSYYPHIASTSRDTPSACLNIAPTPVPELRHRNLQQRQVPDSLGWNDPLTCNVGVCASSLYCTVFGTPSAVTDAVVGVCCVAGPSCPLRTSCVDLASHTISTIGTQLAVYTNGTIFCGTSYPYCSSRFVKYGYGLGTFVDVDCYNKQIGQMTNTVLNPSWRLYATETNPAKGPRPSITYTTESTTAPSSSMTASTATAAPTATASPGKQGLSTGAIAGIAVGGIATIALCVLAVIAVRHFLKAPTPPPPAPMVYQEKQQPMSPAPVYTQQQGYYPPEQQQHQQQPVYGSGGAGYQGGETGYHHAPQGPPPGVHQLA
ncbi:hypothetical protein BDD12DRAFT_828304 [Trichophaea hybrida]|nr:hypothetical protein BDD12DRAFT_828304 [Trichophaea hybrida]